MPRKARVEFPGAVYHLLERGDRREAIVRDDADRVLFLQTLGQACERSGWRVHAFVLDDQPLPFAAGDARTELGGGDALVPDDLQRAEWGGRA